MGHEINYISVPEKMTKTEIQAELEDYAYEHDLPRRVHPSAASIRFIQNTPVCENYDDAIRLIEKQDKGWYDQLAVRYKEYDGKAINSSKNAQEALAKAQKATKHYNELASKIHYADAKASYISCPKCGSKLNREWLTKKRSNSCLVCNAELRPASAMEHIDNAKKAKEKAWEAYEQAKQNAQKKASYKIMWLIKLEWHI